MAVITAVMSSLWGNTIVCIMYQVLAVLLIKTLFSGTRCGIPCSTYGSEAHLKVLTADPAKCCSRTIDTPGYSVGFGIRRGSGLNLTPVCGRAPGIPRKAVLFRIHYDDSYESYTLCTGTKGIVCRRGSMRTELRPGQCLVLVNGDRIEFPGCASSCTLLYCRGA